MESLIEARQTHLKDRMMRTSLNALRAMASMQSRPFPFLTQIDAPTAIVGQVRYERPVGHGGAVYDPVPTAQSFVEAGADAIAVFAPGNSDHDITIDLTLINDAMRFSETPIISQDYVLHEYHVVEARAAGASVVTLTAGFVSLDKLRQLTSAVHRNRMTAVVHIHDHNELEAVLAWTPQVIGLSSPDPVSIEVDLDFVREMREQIPCGQQVMITQPLLTLDEVRAAMALNVHAVTVDHYLLNDPQQAEQLRAARHRL